MVRKLLIVVQRQYKANELTRELSRELSSFCVKTAKHNERVRVARCMPTYKHDAEMKH